MNNPFSIKSMRMSASEVCIEHPCTLSFCIVTAVAIMLMTHGVDEKLIQALAVYASTGALASLGMEWCRRVYNPKKVYSVAIAVHAALLCNAIYFVYRDMDTAVVFDELVVYALCVLLPFIFPFAKSNIHLWHFVRNFCLNAVLTTIIITLVQIGWGVLATCFYLLFQCDVSMLALDGSVILWIVGWPMLQLMRVGIDNDVRVGRASDRLSVFVLRIFTVLLIAYELLLVFYIMKILLMWQLPDGMVAMPVSCMMVLLIIVMFMAYGIALPKKGTNMKVLRSLLYIALPALVLMSVAILRRVMDYGLTPPRVYLMVLNVMSYATCLYFMRWRRPMPILLSFIVAGSLMSFGPTSVWRLFCVDEGKATAVVEGKSPLDTYAYMGNYFSDGYEICLPSNAKKITYVEESSVDEVVSPSEHDGKYKVDAIPGYPFVISREQLTNESKCSYPLVLKCTNGRSFILCRLHCRYSNSPDEKKVEILSVEGFKVE